MVVVHAVQEDGGDPIRSPPLLLDDVFSFLLGVLLRPDEPLLKRHADCGLIAVQDVVQHASYSTPWP